MLKSIGRIVLVTALYLGWHIPFDSTNAGAQNVIAAERITFEGPGGNVGAMRETTQITKVEVNDKGIVITAGKLALPVTRGGSGWPDTCVPFDTCKEPGIDMGALQYSLGFVLPLNGQFYGSAPIENWYERPNGGTGNLTDQSVACANGIGQFQCNIYYDGRWPNLKQVRPQPGDEVGVFVLAGDARNGYVPLGERSNFVTFKLPAPGGSTTVEFTAAPQPGGESVADTLIRVRNKYPALINQAQAGQVLNETAWVHRAEGIVLLGKAGGNNCPAPSGARISCDFLVNANTRRGWDVLTASPDPSGPSTASPNGPNGAGEDLSDALANGSRTLVAPTDPTGVGPVEPPQPPAPGVQGPPGPKGDKGDKGDPADPIQVQDLYNLVHDLQAQLDALKNNAPKIPTGCKAGGSLFGIKVSIHCELTY